MKTVAICVRAMSTLFLVAGVGCGAGCIVSGCAMASGVSSSLPLANKVHLANKKANEIAIYSEDSLPEKEVVYIADIAAHGNVEANFDTLRNAIKKEAAKIGAELVILTDYQVSKDVDIETVA
ncbi:MAG: hypothetical protein NTZ17_19670 [Phycisphaerae bacterium]|nr:hypothetical protein [Phycisphaerae bacterium]